ANECHAWPQRYLGHPFAPVARLAHDPDGTLFVCCNLEASFRGKSEKEEHMAARKRRHERFLRIDTGRVRKRRAHHMRRSGRVDVRPAVELPFVCTAIAAGDEALICSGSQRTVAS